MKRREFIGLVSSAAAGWPLSAGTQQLKVYRVGFLLGATGESVASLFHALKEGLRERGYVEGRNIAFVERYGNGKLERLPDLAAELVRLKVDVIVTGTNPHVVAARQATSTLPIVMVFAADPVSAGFVASLARPGGNVTGLTSDASSEFWAKSLSLLTELVPRLSRVGLLQQISSQVGFAELDAASRKLNVSLEVVDFQRPEDIDSVFATMISKRAEALLVVGGPLNYLLRREIADAALKHRLPTMANVTQFAQAGMLMSYGPDLEDEWRRAAVYVDKILNGAVPADLPVEQPTAFEFVINLETAKALGISIPAATLATANKVIE
jgi:putative tryptophan/tyrosine transport system substrate-binding protein